MYVSIGKTTVMIVSMKKRVKLKKLKIFIEKGKLKRFRNSSILETG